MYDKQMEDLINAALADGELTEKEKQILFKKAESMGIDLDEFEMVLDARLVEFKKQEMLQEKNHELEMAKVKAAAQTSAPKSDKFGDVRKCPACGAIVKAGLAVCPECGYEFANVGAVMSSEKLAELLRAAEPHKMGQIIETFPIPNAKADLLEFLTSMRPHILDSEDNYRSSYWKKYQECIEKARLSFSTDKMFSTFFESYEKDKKMISRDKSMRKLKNAASSGLGGFGLTIVALCTSVISAVSKTIGYFADLFKHGGCLMKIVAGYVLLMVVMIGGCVAIPFLIIRGIFGIFGIREQ